MSRRYGWNGKISSASRPCGDLSNDRVHKAYPLIAFATSRTCDALILRTLRAGRRRSAGAASTISSLGRRSFRPPRLLGGPAHAAAIGAGIELHRRGSCHLHRPARSTTSAWCRSPAERARCQPAGNIHGDALLAFALPIPIFMNSSSVP
jgi:hypothetical protein